MSQINTRLQNDEAFRGDLEASTERLLSVRDAKSILDERDHPGGGPRHVKCLHAHTAHHLVAGDNPVGREVITALRWAESGDPCV